jgi:hypothetical protein
MKTFILILLMGLLGCMTIKEVPVHFASRDNNVCKVLKGKVVLYAIFVDSKHTGPWTTYDLTSTLDSIQIAMDWIMKIAHENDIALDIIVEHHKATNGSIPIYNDFSRKSLSATLFKMPLGSGVRDIYSWADKIATEAGKSLPPDTSLIIKTPNNRINNRERLIARLRDLHRTDNVALVYFINNYYMQDISVAFDTNSHSNVEFSIVSFKSPSVIAHEFLHLFGAWDLYITPFDKKKTDLKKKQLAMELFPKEIMAFAYRQLDSLEIGNFTKYAIGWEKQLDKKYSDLIIGKKLKPVDY